MDLDEVLAATFTLVAPHLSERQRRLLFGAAARALGYGGVSRVARLAEASRPTVRRGAVELDQPADPRGRIRQHEGPKRRRDTDPGLLAALDRLVEPDTRGDPQSPLRWTCKSTRELAQALTGQGHPVSDDTVGRLLKQQGYRLQVRIGIDTGPVEAGVIGTSKFSYDLWGDTVNTASRMESHGIAGCIQVTERTYQRLRDGYRFQRRGPIQVRGKGEMVTYFLVGRNQ